MVSSNQVRLNARSCARHRGKLVINIAVASTRASAKYTPYIAHFIFLPIFPSLHPPYLGTRTRQAMRAFNRANPSPELNQTLTQAGRQAMRAFDRADPSPELNQTLKQADRQVGRQADNQHSIGLTPPRIESDTDTGR